MARILSLFLCLIPGLAGFMACAGEKALEEDETRTDPYYLTGAGEYQGTLESLFYLLKGESDREEGQFAVVREIANTYMRQKEYGRLINFLGSRINKDPQDPYNAYYMFMTAYAYMQQEAYPVAALYFELILKNYPDLTSLDQSIHLACLNQLITLVDNPEQRVRYYEELISQFSDKIDLGTVYFMLAQAYERTGEWNGAIQAYTRFLPYMGANIPGFPNADTYAKHLVDFNNSSKNWTFESLNSLLGAVRAALDGGSSSRLEQIRAKVNFFARSWEQEETDDSGMAEFNLSDFMRGNRIRYAPSLDAGSNANEAYLRTWGWSQYISTWYLYFRKIYFPPDPEIHGRWEWAGVYYGEKF
ncbi:MAG: tetratricopeptide repeat protein [Treponema sp.]|nr:tetratricopeptide repeat protein [Treponema sp.]